MNDFVEFDSHCDLEILSFNKRQTPSSYRIYIDDLQYYSSDQVTLVNSNLVILHKKAE